MNTGYEETLDKNFERALDLCSGDFSHDQLLTFLKEGNMPERQFAALELETINSQEEAEIFISNLTGCDGKIREAVAYKLSEFAKDYGCLFSKYPKIFADATIDINANICRMIIEVLCYFKDDAKFVNEYLDAVQKFINEALDKLDSFNFRDKKYTINKQLFKIYWCLEGINVFSDKIDEASLYSILSRCSEIEEYTIREKVALILKKQFNSDNLNQLRNILKSDENYYVKNI